MNKIIVILSFVVMIAIGCAFNNPVLSGVEGGFSAACLGSGVGCFISGVISGVDLTVAGVQAVKGSETSKTQLPTNYGQGVLVDAKVLSNKTYEGLLVK